MMQFVGLVNVPSVVMMNWWWWCRQRGLIVTLRQIRSGRPPRCWGIQYSSPSISSCDVVMSDVTSSTGDYSLYMNALPLEKTGTSRRCAGRYPFLQGSGFSPEMFRI